MYKSNLRLGQIVGYPSSVLSLNVKSGCNIAPGDFVKIVEKSNGTAPKAIEVEKVSAATDYIFGVAVSDTDSDKCIVSIITDGRVIANVSSLHSGAGVGKHVDHGKAGEKCCNIIILNKVSAIKKDLSVDSSTAYEVLIR